MTETPPATSRRSFWWLNGRAGRAEYWVAIAFIMILGVALSFVPGLQGAANGLWVVILFVQMRRMHDLGRSGWWAVLATVAVMVVTVVSVMLTALETGFLIGMAAQFAVIIGIGALRGDPEANRFGPPAPFSWKRTLTGR